MKLYNPAWIVAGAVILAQATGVINVFTTAASVLVAIDGTVNALIDFKKWAPQVKDYVHANTPDRRVLLAPGQHDKRVVRNGAKGQQDPAGGGRVRDGTRTAAQEVVPTPQPEWTPR